MVCIASNSGELTVFDSKTGQRLWHYDAKEVIKSSPIIVGDYVLFGTMAGKLYSMKVADGAHVSKRELAGAISQSPISDGQFIYVATDAGELVCLGDRLETTTLNK
jgi:outer membrane protein assembly factor BamB